MAYVLKRGKSWQVRVRQTIAGKKLDYSRSFPAEAQARHWGKFREGFDWFIMEDDAGKWPAFVTEPIGDWPTGDYSMRRGWCTR